MSNANPTYIPNYSYTTHCQLVAEGMPLPSYSSAPVQTVTPTSVQAPVATSAPQASGSARGK